MKKTKKYDDIYISVDGSVYADYNLMVPGPNSDTSHSMGLGDKVCHETMSYDMSLGPLIYMLK